MVESQVASQIPSTHDEPEARHRVPSEHRPTCDAHVPSTHLAPWPPQSASALQASLAIDPSEASPLVAESTVARGGAICPGVASRPEHDALREAIRQLADVPVGAGVVAAAPRIPRIRAGGCRRGAVSLAGGDIPNVAVAILLALPAGARGRRVGARAPADP